MFTPSLPRSSFHREIADFPTRHGSNKISTARGLALEFSNHPPAIDRHTDTAIIPIRPSRTGEIAQNPDRATRKIKKCWWTKANETIFSSRIRGRLSNGGEEKKNAMTQG